MKFYAPHIVHSVPYQANSGPPKVLPRARLLVIYKKKLCNATSRGRMDFKQTILIADTILAEPGP